MVLFFLFLLLVVLEGTFSGSSVMAGALPDSVMLSFATRVTYDNDIHQKKKKRNNS